MMKVLHLDENHPLLISGLEQLGFENVVDTTSSKKAIESLVKNYDGLVVRSRIPIDQTIIKKGVRLKFIARVGAGLENIDVEAAKKKGVNVIAAPEGNRNAVGEHALGMLLALLNNMNRAFEEIKSGLWIRSGNRGTELSGKTVGIIGYGNTGKNFAQKLKGLDVNVLCVDILKNVGDDFATQVSMKVLQKQADIISLHTPQSPKTLGLIDQKFIRQCQKPFWLINTARGKSVVTHDLVEALKQGKVQGAALDVLEYEQSSFENLFQSKNLSKDFQYLLEAPNVLLTPHIAGWTHESHQKMAQTIVQKVAKLL